MFHFEQWTVAFRNPAVIGIALVGHVTAAHQDDVIGLGCPTFSVDDVKNSRRFINMATLYSVENIALKWINLKASIAWTHAYQVVHLRAGTVKGVVYKTTEITTCGIGVDHWPFMSSIMREPIDHTHAPTQRQNTKTHAYTHMQI